VVGGDRLEKTGILIGNDSIAVVGQEDDREMQISAEMLRLLQYLATEKGGNQNIYELCETIGYPAIRTHRTTCGLNALR
jgi:hypothetical protein